MSESEAAVYAVASGKGGVGKTTTAINLAAALAESREVCVVDADLGMATLAAALDLSIDGPTIHDVLTGGTSIDDATYEYGEFAVVPGETTLDAYAAADPAGLREALDELRSTFDVVFLDVGAGLSHDTVVPLGAADRVLLVATPEPPAIENVRTTREMADRVGTDVLGAVLARADPERPVEPIEDALGVRALAVIPEHEAVPESLAAGEPVVTRAPGSPAAAGYAELANRLDDGAFGDGPFPVRPIEEEEGGDAEDEEEPAAEEASAAETPATGGTIDEPELETGASETEERTDEDATEAADPDAKAETDDADPDPAPEPESAEEASGPRSASEPVDADDGPAEPSDDPRGGLLSRLLGRS